MPPMALNRRAITVIAGTLLLLLLLTGGITHRQVIKEHLPDWPIKSNLDPPVKDEPPEIPVQPFREEIFPIANTGKIPAINPKNIVKTDEKTPLFIGFTRNWYLLEQAVVSYIAAGWPASQIIVVDNSGVMDSNLRGLLSARNPWYLNHTRLDFLGVTVKRTPTLLSFAQLQNFYINYAVEQNWGYFFWSHMDVVALSKEYEEQYNPFYNRAVECLKHAKTEPVDKWALKFFAYDWLTLVNVEAMKAVGGWDTQIPYYMTDCDMYERLTQHNYTQDGCDAGHIFDVASHLVDLEVLFPTGPEEELDSERFKNLKLELERMMGEKQQNKKGRNTWQARQDGGQGEPFWRHPKGFERAINFWIDKGRELFNLKWGYPDCDIRAHGRKAGDEWRYKDLDHLATYDKRDLTQVEI
ncbi:hypothetical protein ABW19_dt0203185 [Dactylella cylindrospora]|nr:hypothetical protein ABW19_dt0203185 [Dactylella cylindrospora]